ncbi:MAG TPA: hypothetical protein VNQ73_18185 [Ilumatobacter sp.]|nr:hypothetical protein [Ilumatobacter sp.]
MTNVDGPSAAPGTVRFEARRAEVLERASVAAARSSFSLLRVQASGLRRLDLWVGPDVVCVHGFVDGDTVSGGFEAPAILFDINLANLVLRMVGPLAATSHARARTVLAGELATPRLPDDINTALWAWGANRRPGASATVLAITDAGVLGGAADGDADPVELVPVSAARAWAALRATFA